MNSKSKNFILILFIFVTSSFKSFGTGQTADILIYKSDTFSLFANPLEQLFNIDSLRSTLFGNKQGCPTTSCWRLYQAEWEIIDNELYLTNIYSCCFYEDKIKADLKSLFGKKYKQGKVKADWVNDKMLSPQGKELYYVHDDYRSLYEKEVIYEIENGVLKSVVTYDNSKSKKSIYSGDKAFQNYIYSNINWEALPLDDKKNRVFVQFSANEQGIIDSLTVLKGVNKVFDNEATRVIKSIPVWDIFYRLGKHERRYLTLPITFSSDMKRKYIKK